MITGKGKLDNLDQQKNRNKSNQNEKQIQRQGEKTTFRGEIASTAGCRVRERDHIAASAAGREVLRREKADGVF